MSDVPTDKVREMRDQGMSDNEIVESLQSDGYKSPQIFDAMTQSDMNPAQNASDVTGDFPDVTGQVNDGAPGQTPPPGPQAPSPSPQGQGSLDANTEELVERIIEEKWESIEDDIKKVVDWKKDTEQQLEQLENELDSLERRFDKLHGAIVGKVGEYDKNLSNVASEIDAMQEAFSKMLPRFSESVNELAGIVDDLKDDE